MKAQPEEGIRVRGSFRLNLMAPGDEFTVIGDSGWVTNQVTNDGFLNIVQQLGTSLTGSKVSHLALGTGGAPASDATSLSGEVQVRAALTAASNGSTGLQMTATFSSANSFITATDGEPISNIGVFCTSDTSGGTLICGNTYSSSTCASNQNVNATYLLTFAQA